MKNFRLRTQLKTHDQGAVSKDDLINILSHVINNFQLGSSRIQLKNDDQDSGNIIKINNFARIARREKYTKDIKEQIDPRDRQILLPFDITINLTGFKKQKKAIQSHTKLSEDQDENGIPILKENMKFIQSKQYLKLRRQIFEYTSEVCENVSSVAFQLLNQNKLTENQVKAFASKNILANIQSVMSKINETFKQSNFFDNKQMEQILSTLIKEIDEELKKIFTQLASYYPQAPAVGQTARIREAIADVNRSQDETNDIIITKNIRIRDYKSDAEGQNPQIYTGFVMEVINAAINIARESFLVGQEQTVFEKFHQFSEQLFYTSQNNQCKSVFERINSSSKNIKLMDSDQLEKDIIQHYVKIFKKKQQKIQDKGQNLINRFDKQQSIEQMRNHHKYGIAQKIPNYVKPFSISDIQTNNFHVNNSSVLRIMTKWADYLQQIFQKPEHHIYQRVYEFKNLNNNLISLKNADKDVLCKSLKEQYVTLKEQFKKLREKNTTFQGFLLSGKDISGSTYLKRFTEIRSASSEMTVVLIQFTRKYLCLLIHHLLKAGQGKFDTTNLVTFRVGDLLRSKFQCSQTAFVNVLNTLYLLDGSRQMEGLFKLVRIKNKLNQRDNNILINYLFLGKVQCQLQLSIQDLGKKDKNYYAFSHFLYQLTRGKFGVLTQCATIVSQHDPVLSSCSDSYYRPKYYQQPPVDKIHLQSIHLKDQNLFMCWHCLKLTVRQNVQLFSESQNMCNQCIAASNEPQRKLTEEINRGLKSCLLENLSQKRIKRIYNHSGLLPNKYILSISNRKERNIPKLFRVWQNKRQYKLALIEIKDQVLLNFDEPGFDFRTISYFQINKKQTLNQLTYIIDEEDLSHIFPILSVQVSLLSKMKQFEQAFQSYMLQTSLIKSIKYGCQILDFRGDLKKLEVMNQVATAFAEKDINRLKYKRYHKLQYTHLRKVTLEGMKLKQVPSFLKYTDSIEVLQLQNNQLTSFSLENCSSLKKLHLDKNKLNQVNLKGQVNLMKLYIRQNELNQIDLSKNTKLERLQLSTNQMTSIDLTKNPRLKQISLLYNNLSSISFISSSELINQVNFIYQNSDSCNVTILHRKQQDQQAKKLKKNIQEFIDEKSERCKYSIKLICLD